MYTGVVRHTGRIASVDDYHDGAALHVATPDLGLEPGESVAVDGVCLTVEATADDGFRAFASDETVACTALVERAGDPVNLEAPVSLRDALDGHLTKGTVDTVTTVERVDRESEDGTWTYHVAIPDGHARHVAAKGAVALDGVSLTVDRVDDGRGTFAVAVVPETRDRTTLSERGAGDSVHFEADVLARYAARASEVGT
ncbi:riboflavin synthase [Halorubellus salinus]|uniref:riboflavin synthase n=1 Tax=Halorubellus salinus TaxID=755309 RepID=UPI001D097067|nr:riboflavin synthase [Halorubellus salinus]